MGFKGRRPTKEIKLADGFYIEVRNKGIKEKGIRIKSVSKETMQVAAEQYGKNKDVTLLGEFAQGEWIKN